MLGAYFNRVPGAQIVVGSYELSGTPDAPGPAEQAVADALRLVAPAGPYTVWASRSGDDAFEEQAPQDRLLYALTDAQVDASERLVGEPPAYLAILTDAPPDTASIQNAVSGSRYAWSKSEAIYSQADPSRIPKMQFLNWAVLRPAADWKGRSETPQRASARIGGTLVFPVQIPVSTSDRELPQASFNDAFAAAFPSAGKLLPQVVRAPEAGDATAVAARNALAVMLVVGAGALAVWGGYRMTQSLRGAHA